MGTSLVRIPLVSVLLVAAVVLGLRLTADDGAEETVSAEDEVASSSTTAPSSQVETTAVAADRLLPALAADEVGPLNETEPDPEPDPDMLHFATQIETGELGDTFIRFRFAASHGTSYTAVVSKDGVVVGTTDGSAPAGEIEPNRIDGLEPDTLYTIQVTLIGPPGVQSDPLQFRTSGSSGDPELDRQTPKVEFMDLEMTSLQYNKASFKYRASVCSIGLFVVIEQETGQEVGQNRGLDEGCVDRHLAIPGQWTPELKSETTYILLLTLEANGLGRGLPYGNVATEAIVFTTPARPVPPDPSERGVAAVEFVNIEQKETGTTDVRIDYETNICTHGSFVIREIGGAEVGRHSGFPRGCSTTHSAIPGLWTEPLEPDTSYVVVVTAEADGPGQGDGNAATESVSVRTAPVRSEEAPVEPVEITDLEVTATGGEVTANFATSACATSVVSTFGEGRLFVDSVEDTECSTTHSVSGLDLATDGPTVVVVSVSDPDAGSVANRASEIAVVAGP